MQSDRRLEEHGCASCGPLIFSGAPALSQEAHHGGQHSSWTPVDAAEPACFPSPFWRDVSLLICKNPFVCNVL